MATFDRSDGIGEVKIIRSDNAPEITQGRAKEMYDRKYITNIKSVPHEHDNSLVERVIQTINNIAVSQLALGKFTDEEFVDFYFNSVKNAAFVYNMRPHRALKFVTPFEKWYDIRPNINWWRAQYATAWYYVETQFRPNGKRDRRFGCGIVVGVEFNTARPRTNRTIPALKIYVPSSGTTFVKRSHIVDERFAHKETRFSELENGAVYIDIEDDDAGNTEQIKLPKHPVQFEGMVPPPVEGVGNDDANGVVKSPKNFEDKQPNNSDEDFESLSADDDYVQDEKVEPTKTAPVRCSERIRKRNKLMADRRIRIAQFRDEKNIVVISVTAGSSHTSTTGVKYYKSLEKMSHEVSDENIVDAVDSAFDNPSYAEAMCRHDKSSWVKAIKTEIDTLVAKGTWREVDASQVNIRPLGTKWVMKIKRDPTTGAIIKYKARLTAQGFLQIKGLEFNDTSSPVAELASVKFLVAHALQHDRKLSLVDFAGAFLHAHLKEEIHIRPPKGYAPEGKLWRLLKTIYGLKQSSHEWHAVLCKALAEMGFVRADRTIDECLFYHQGRNIYIATHVDDCFISFVKDDDLAWLVTTLENKKFDISAVDELTKGLGLSFNRTESSISITQTKYIECMVNDFKVDITRRVYTPILKREDARGDDEKIFDSTKYRSLLGTLAHIARFTRVDIMMAVFHLATFSHNPCQRHFDALLRITQFLYTTKFRGIKFTKTPLNSRWTFYVDADWAGDSNTRRSTSGFLIQYCQGPLICVSRRQQLVTLSSSEAEYCAFTEAVKDIIWAKNISKFFNEPFPEPACLYNDNKTAESIANEEAKVKRTKHIHARYHWIREHIKAGTIKLVHVSTLDNLADLWTKPLGRIVFERLSEAVMDIPIVVHPIT